MHPITRAHLVGAPQAPSDAVANGTPDFVATVVGAVVIVELRAASVAWCWALLGGASVYMVAVWALAHVANRVSS